MGEKYLKKISKKGILGLVLCALLVIAISVRLYLDYKNMDKPLKETEISEGTKKFKQEYETLNGTKTSSDKDYLNVTIDESIVIQPKSDEEIVGILNNGTGVVYFGFDTCHWCRSMIETLLESVKESKVVDFYYVNVKDIRSSFEVKNKKLTNTKEGTESYYKILEKLDEYLEDYKLEDNNKSYDTKEKRLYAPTVVTFKDGKIVGFHQGTVESQTDPYLGLNDEEKKELKSIYDEMLSKLESTTCDNNKAGC